jgi:flagellar biosynthetic protein FliP
LTLTGLLGVMAALAFVLGLLFVALRLLRHLPALARQAGEGPELRVLSRAGLNPRQGLATVQVGDSLLVVGYGEGGVRLVAELDEAQAGSGLGDAAAVLDSPALEGASEMTAPSNPLAGETGGGAGWSGALARSGGIPFRQALARAVRSRAGGLGLGLLLALGMAGSAPASLEGATPARVGIPATLVAFQTPQAPVSRPSVEGPRPMGDVTVPGADFPSVEVSLGAGDEQALRLSGPVGTVVFVGFLTLLPALLLLMTSFTRILVVLHLLKQAIGTQTAPPAQLLAAMALLLTGFVMAPTLQEANATAVRPWMDGQIDEVQMLDSASVPFRAFMLSNVRDSDVRTFVQMQTGPAPESVDDIPLTVLASAFVTSELRSAFQMGFALFLPFVIIDIVVASVLMSMGMFMLPPVMVSLPFKLLLFVMVDGWGLVIGSLVRSFG